MDYDSLKNSEICSQNDLILKTGIAKEIFCIGFRIAGLRNIVWKWVRIKETLK